MASDPPRLPERAEALLQSFRFPERDDEAAAHAIEERLRDVTVGSAPSDLLAAPLPQQPGEPGEPPAASVPGGRAAGPSLADLARQVAPKSVRSESSLLYKQSLSVAAAARVKPEALLERLRSAPAAAGSSKTLPAAPVDVVAPPSAIAEAPVQTERPAAATERRRVGVPFLAGMGVALAVAAAFSLFIRTPDAAAPTGSIASSSNTGPGPGASALGAEAATRAPASSATLPRVESSPAPPAALDSLPVEPRKPELEQATPSALPPRSAAPRSESAVASKTGAATGMHAPPGALSAAAQAVPRPAVGASPSESGPRPRPAAGTSSGLPDTPSSGAVQAALGGVLGAARNCLAGASSASAAIVVFGSTGVVSSVSVSPSGTSAAACVQNALSRARVSPFAARSFSVKVPVRP